MKIKPFFILLLVVNISLATVFSFTAAAVGEYGKNAVENLGKKVVNKVQELIE